MERLTYLTKDSWGIKGNIDNAVIRLAEIEDIIGDEYNLDRLRELVETDNQKPIPWEELRQENEIPVFIVDLYHEGRTGWYILSWDYRKSGQYLVLSSRHCNGFLSNEYGESWIAYRQKPKEAESN